MKMSEIIRGKYVWVLSSILIIFLVMDLFIVLPSWWRPSSVLLQRWASQVLAFGTFLFAFLSLCKYHINIILKRKENWVFSILTLFISIATIIVGLTQGISSDSYMWIFKQVYQKLGTVLYGIFAFYIATALYRSFRIYTLEGAALAFSFITVMCSIAPALSYIPLLGDIGLFLSMAVGANGYRSVILGTGIATVAIAFRLIIGVEKGAAMGFE